MLTRNVRSDCSLDSSAKSLTGCWMAMLTNTRGRPARIPRARPRAGSSPRPAPRSRGWPAVVGVPHQPVAGHDGQADAADEQDQHAYHVQIGRDQPERANAQPQQDDQSNRAHDSRAPYISVSPNPPMHLFEKVEYTSRVPRHDG